MMLDVTNILAAAQTAHDREMVQQQIDALVYELPQGADGEGNHGD